MKTWFKKDLMVSCLLAVSLLFGLNAPLAMAANDRANMSDKVREFASSQGQDEVDVIVRYKMVPDAADMAHVNALGGTVKKSFGRIPMQVIRIPADSLEALSEVQGVKSISLDSTVKRFSQPAQVTAKLPSYGAPEFFPVDPNVRVAVLDSGVSNHSDLNVQMRVDFTEVLAIRTFADNLNVKSFTNTDGTDNWSNNPWIETNDDGMAGSGDIAIQTDSRCPRSCQPLRGIR